MVEYLTVNIKSSVSVIIKISGIFIVIGLVFLIARSQSSSFFPSEPSVPTPPQTTTTPPSPSTPDSALVPPQAPVTYHSVTLTTSNPIKELAELVGANNMHTVLKLNRIDNTSIPAKSTFVVPDDIQEWATYSPFPTYLGTATSIPKLMMVSQRVQAFGIYEYGTLIRWGPVSTGKKTTLTPSRLYYTNWKGKEVQSSFDDEWILKWNFNLDNHEGIGMHEYEMPGYPASHSCIRMFADDAQWVYNWADQWQLSDNGQTILVYGTPVLVFGEYHYGTPPPWKLLPKNPEATTLTMTELEQALSPSLSDVLQKNTSAQY